MLDLSRSAARLLGGLLLTVTAIATPAQGYPQRPVKIIVPSSPGGGTDSATRIATRKIEQFLKQRIVVENRAGAGSMIGSEIVARSPADGYTLLAAISSITIQPSIQKNLSFDPVKDFVAVSQLVTLPNMLVGHPSLQAKTLPALIAFSRAHPGQLSYASAGKGSNLHLCMELFLNLTGLKMEHVPYKGSGQAIADLVAGYVPLMVTNMITGTQQVRAGKLRAYGVTSTARSDAAPDIPTIAELGVKGYDAVQWYGVMAPVGTPRDVVAKLHQAVVAAVSDSGVRQRYRDSGAVPVGNSPDEFAAVVKADITKWAKVVRAAGLSPR